MLQLANVIATLKQTFSALLPIGLHSNLLQDAHEPGYFQAVVAFLLFGMSQFFRLITFSLSLPGHLYILVFGAAKCSVGFACADGTWRYGLLGGSERTPLWEICYEHHCASAGVSVTTVVPLWPLLILPAVFLAKILLPVLYQPLYEKFSVLSRDFISRITSATVGHSVRTGTLRTKFFEIDITSARASRAFPHPDSAGARSGASKFVDELELLTGQRFHFYQMSGHDQRKERVGSRSYFWAKDVKAEPAPFVPGPQALIDVDYYVNMPSFLAKQKAPVVLYTMVPEAAAKSNGDYSYTFTPTGKLSVKYGGGAAYEHPLWDYGNDTLYAAEWWGWMPRRATYYNVVRRNASADRQVILLEPLFHCSNPISMLVGYWIYGHPLKRFNPVFNGFVRFKIQKDDGLFVTTGKVGAYGELTIPAQTDSGLHSAAATSTAKITAGTIQSHVRDAKPCDTYVYLEYLRSAVASTPPTVFSPEHSVRRYQFGDAALVQKPGMIAFMSPIIHEAFAPDVTAPNERMAIQKRITEVRNKAKVNSFLLATRQEFVECFREDIQYVNLLHPVDVSEVWRKQHRPMQQATLQQADYTDEPKRVGKSFLKREAYREPKDPRIITTINGKDKLVWSTFTYALSDYLKKYDWYAIGKTPRKIAERVAEICSTTTEVVEGDLSRMDGRGSDFLIGVFEAVCLALFHPDYHVTISECIRNMSYLTCSTPHGEFYDQEAATASGQPATSLMNSIISFYMIFLAARKTLVARGLFIHRHRAFATPAIVCGDDTLFSGVKADLFTAACSSVGHVAKAIVRRQDAKLPDNCPTFLARIYSPDVWHGSEYSMCDVRRQLSKLHVTTKLPPNVSPEDKLLEKLRSLWLSDNMTPLITLLTLRAKLVCRHTEFENFDPEIDLYGLRNFHTRVTMSEQYPQAKVEEDWMLDYVRYQLPGFDYDAFIDHVSKSYSMTELLKFPCCIEPSHACPPATATVTNPDHTELVVVPVVQQEPDDTKLAAARAGKKKAVLKKKRVNNPDHKEKEKSSGASRKGDDRKKVRSASPEKPP